jgi:MFS family permease
VTIEAADRSERQRLPPVVWILSVIAICVAVGFGIVAPALPVFAREFGVGRTAAALVISLFAAARMASAFGVGRLVDIFGARPVLGAGLLVVAVSSALAGLSQDYLQLLLLRGAGGAGSAMFSVAAASVMASRVPSEIRGRAMGVWSGSFLLGGVLGPVIGGPLTAISLRAPFFFYAGTLAVAAVVAFAALPRVPRRPSAARRDDIPAEGMREAWALPEFRVALVADLADKWAISVRTAIVPLFITEALMLGEEWSGYALAVAAAVNAALLLPFGRWSDRRGRLGVVLVGGLAGAGGMAALAAPPALWLMLVAMVVLGLGASAQAVGPSAILGDVASGRRGSVIATYQVVGDVGSMVGPLVAGGLADALGFPAAFGSTAAICFLSAAFAGRYVRRERPPASRPAGA